MGKYSPGGRSVGYEGWEFGGVEIARYEATFAKCKLAIVIAIL
jgi:hypothetical protein